MPKPKQTLGSIMFKGKPVLAQLGMVDNTTSVLYFKHMYQTTFALTNELVPRRHACLKMGYWCWRNALRHPQDVMPYLRRKR